MKLLVSVRSEAEALLAAQGGADFIDLKDPGAGALGALPPATIRAIVATLRSTHPQRPISATVGDVEPGTEDAALRRAEATAACGVDYVKVGVPARLGNGAPLRWLQALAATGSPIVPVFIADHGLDGAVIDAACALPFPALMVDTQDKSRGSLFALADAAVLGEFVARVRLAGKLSGLAGALRQDDLPRLRALAPDFAGFRSAVCAGARNGPLDLGRLVTLRRALTTGEAFASQT